MRIVTYGAACSLDGFITGPDGSIDWLHFSPDVHQIMATYWATVDTVLMGRKTYEAAVASNPKGAASAGMQTYVLSRTLAQPSERGVTVVADDAAAFVRELKSRPGKGICLLGGGELGTALVAAGVVDEIGLNIHPVILGSGTPFFRDPGRRVPLELVESRTLDGGCILATYRLRTPAVTSRRRGGKAASRRSAS